MAFELEDFSPKQMLDAIAVMHKALRIQSQHGQQLAQLLA